MSHGFGRWGLRAGLLVAIAAADSSVLDVLSPSRHQVCVRCNEGWGILPIGAESAKHLKATWVTPAGGGCVNSTHNTPADITNSGALAGKAALFTRGNCTFSSMVMAANNANASAVLIVNSANGSLVIPAASNASDYDHFQRPVCMIPHDIQHIVSGGYTLRLYDPQYPVLDGACFVFLVLALGVLLTGSYCGTFRERERVIKLRRSQSTNSDTDAHSLLPPPRDPNESQLLTSKMVLFFIVFASTFLILLYFFYQYLIYLVLGGFALFGALSVYEIFADLLSQTQLWEMARVDLPKSKDTPAVAIATALSAIGVAVAWLATRHETYSWILQDVLGVPILISIIRVVLVPNLKIATALLCCLLVYDVFFVFVTPYITSDGASVMVHAATGGDTQTDDNGCSSYTNMMPFLLKIPALNRPPCTCPHYSMLGFGDIALPGFVVALSLRFDYARAINGARDRTTLRRYRYFVGSLLGYSVGLVCAFVAASQMKMAQPALLYLSPSTLLSIWIPAWYRGEISQLLDLEGYLGYRQSERSVNHDRGDDETTAPLLLGTTDGSDTDTEDSKT